ncbi:MAG: MFS transporter [Candidatus Rokubacteria bacterium]|nr:MFS transporter [Candidatus Rokubacteria bacterium]
MPVARVGRSIFYGWAVVAAAFVSHLLSYGVLTVAFGVLFPFMADALGLGRGLLASAGVVTRLTSAAIAPALGPLVDRYGPRRFMLLGILSLAAGSITLALAHATWQVFLGYGVVMAIASVTLGELTGDATVARWFVRRRGRALAFATMGLSTAGIVVPLPLAWIITRHGWRQAWMALGVTSLVLGLAAAAAMRARPEDHGLAPDGDPPPRAPRAGAPITVVAERSLSARQAARTPAFWLLVLSTNLAGLALFGINLHLFSYVTDKGLGVGMAAGLVTYLYVLHTAAKPLWGMIAERIHVRYCIAACYAGGALGVAVLVVSASATALLTFATIYGLTRGAQSFVTSLAWANYFGREAQGAIRGLASPFRFLAAAAGPVVGGLLYDATGSYTIAFVVFAATFALGAATALAARPPRPE